jgi:hypothetical protein
MIGSVHFNNVREYNEFNPGIIIECKGWSVGQYLNSMNNESIIVFYPFTQRINTSTSITLGTGLVSGYFDNIMPGAFVYMTHFINNDIGVTVGALPAFEYDFSGNPSFVGVVFWGLTIKN